MLCYGGGLSMVMWREGGGGVGYCGLGVRRGSGGDLRVIV